MTDQAAQAWVIHVEDVTQVAPDSRAPEERLAEAVNLSEALSQLEVQGGEVLTLRKPNPKTLIGGGQVEQLAVLIAEQDVKVLVVNAALSPSQQRNLEIALSCKVVDRTGLILEIFAERARTKAGRLQVELARLDYEQSRLVRTWTHLERQRGGMGKTGGPGERQLELDRRMLRDRMALLRKQIQRLEQERKVQRAKRQRQQTPVVALVGYTNAGKSTLFNALVDGDTLAQDQLFATLDPLMRKLELPDGQTAVLVDTVGFVSNLPHELVAAFRATLEEVASADLLLHVHDVSADDWQAQQQDVEEVLTEIGAEKLPRLNVFNKADLLEHVDPDLEHELLASAVSGRGITNVLDVVVSKLHERELYLSVQLPLSAGAEHAWFHQNTHIEHENVTEHGWQLTMRIAPQRWAAYAKQKSK